MVEEKNISVGKYFGAKRGPFDIVFVSIKPLNAAAIVDSIVNMVDDNYVR